MGTFFNNEIYLETVESTNTYLKERDFPDKTLIYTFNQTKGRGRYNRVWLDAEEKNLALSVLLKPDNGAENKQGKPVPFSNPLWFVAACSIALIKVLEEKGIAGSWIKWPNDIYIGNAKLSGVLTEIQWSSSTHQKIIVGIGVNVNNTPEDLAELNREGISICQAAGELQDIREFTRDYIRELSDWLTVLYEQHDINTIKESWLRYCDILDKEVEWIDGNQKIYGKVEKIDENGYLVLNAQGTIHTVISGDIIVVP